jgi:hypothetical protein
VSLSGIVVLSVFHTVWRFALCKSGSRMEELEWNSQKGIARIAVPKGLGRVSKCLRVPILLPGRAGDAMRGLHFLQSPDTPRGKWQ